MTERRKTTMKGMKYEAPELKELVESLLLAAGASGGDNIGPGDGGGDLNIEDDF